MSMVIITGDTAVIQKPMSVNAPCAELLVHMFLFGLGVRQAFMLMLVHQLMLSPLVGMCAQKNPPNTGLRSHCHMVLTHSMLPALSVLPSYLEIRTASNLFFRVQLTDNAILQMTIIQLTLLTIYCEDKKLPLTLDFTFFKNKIVINEGFGVGLAAGMWSYFDIWNQTVIGGIACWTAACSWWHLFWLSCSVFVRFVRLEEKYQCLNDFFNIGFFNRNVFFYTLNDKPLKHIFFQSKRSIQNVICPLFLICNIVNLNNSFSKRMYQMFE